MLTVISKVGVMLLLIMVGYVVSKKGMLTERGTSEINTLLLQIVTPCLIVNSFLTSEGTLSVGELLLSVGTSALALVLSIVVSWGFFRKEPEGRQKVLRFAAIFSNSGFMGLPLVEGIVGSEGVMYGSFFIVVFNIFCWTYGFRMMSGGQKMSLKVLLLNPGIIGLIFGLPIYFLRIPIPAVISEPVGFLSALNTPLAMLVVGSYIAKVELHSFVSDLAVYKASALRLLVAPGLFLLLLLVIRPEPNLFITNMIQASCPVAANTVLFAVQYKRDSTLASKMVAVSTVLSIITIPILTILAQMACEMLY
ncbi:MAG: AEC family transporter [Acutalibacter sp.]|jgi:predicted permease